jgi:hypothetical protein
MLTSPIKMTPGPILVRCPPMSEAGRARRRSGQFLTGAEDASLTVFSNDFEVTSSPVAEAYAPSWGNGRMGGGSR